MLKFYDYYVTNSLEVPDEVCLNFQIADCRNRCSNCFTPELWEDTDVYLKDIYEDLVLAYLFKITCVCFLGEGRNTDEEHKEFEHICGAVHDRNLKTCLYCGRNCGIEPWMYIFDYIKIGAYMPEYGDLSCSGTNQRLYKKTTNGYRDITFMFWER